MAKTPKNVTVTKTRTYTGPKAKAESEKLAGGKKGGKC